MANGACRPLLAASSLFDAPALSATSGPEASLPEVLKMRRMLCMSAESAKFALI